jgi:phage terminase Nu1 subunit (DNA packaging protein)
MPKLIKKQKNKTLKRKVLPPRTKKMHLNGIAKPKWQLDKDFIQAKIDLTRVREMSAKLLLAKAREELIEKELITKQATFMFTAVRQRMLAIPTSLARRLLHQTEITVVVSLLRDAIHAALNEAADFPQRITDPDFLKNLENENE